MSIWLIILILVLLFGGGFGSYHTWGAYGPGYGGGLSLGTVCLIILIVYLFGNRAP